MENKKPEIVWITGASSGIGEALALEYARRGCDLVLSSRRILILEGLALKCREFGSRCLVYPLDLEAEEDYKRHVEVVESQFGPVDVLIHSGGVSQRSLAADTSMKVVRRVMEVNFFAAVSLTGALLPKMLERGGGKIGVLSSMAGLFGFMERSGYSASKHALHGYFETLSLENRKKGIFVTMACPGRIHTQISLNALTGEGTPHGKMDRGQEKGISAGHCAREIANAIQKGRRQVIIARGERVLLWIRRWCPPLFFWLTPRLNPNH